MGLSTTPTVEVAVPLEKLRGGITKWQLIIQKQWNALKLLNEKEVF
jgi:phosphomannomutase